MARSGLFYVVKAMERTVAGAAVADAPRVPARQADDRKPVAARPDRSTSSRVRRMLTGLALWRHAERV